MTVKQVGQRLVAMCRARQFSQAVAELYSPDIVSIEAMSDSDTPAELRGLEAVLRKNRDFEANEVVHACEVVGPFPNRDQFAVIFRMDVTAKVGPLANQRMQMEEVAVYTVKAGKIVHEVFYYDMPT